jgi:BirA family biotin operon repressor/biotin-[acetyl-CoA-carboxylase] ligase
LKIIKLDAIDSTNSFLKDLVRTSVLDNFTTVTTKEQKKGRGQQAGSWGSEGGKNLTFSTYVSFLGLEIKQQKHLSFAVSLAVLEVLKLLGIPNLQIKWPNDILTGNDKIAGILIENTLKDKKIQAAIIGIGLNVNQESFPVFSRKATSIKNCLQKDSNLEDTLQLLLQQLQSKLALLNEGQFEFLEAQFLDLLYKKNVPTTFKNRENVLFMGIIKGVSSEGKLQILLDDDSTQEFGIKEVSFA